jgi:hypothetical protein
MNGVSTAQSVGKGVARQVEGNVQSHSLDTLSNEVEGEAIYVQDVESGKIKKVIVLKQESELACDKSDGASDRKLVAPGSAF